MATKGWMGRRAFLSILSGGTESDVLDLGAIETVVATAVCAAGSSTTNVITASIVVPTGFQAYPVTVDLFKGKAVMFRGDTTTAALRNQKRAITANTALGVLTVVALTDAPAAGDVFDIVDMEEAKSYLRWDIQVGSPATVTGVVNLKVSTTEAGTYYTQHSGAAAIVIPTATVATPVIPLIARFMKLVGGAQGQLTHFEVWGTTINSR